MKDVIRLVVILFALGTPLFSQINPNQGDGGGGGGDPTGGGGTPSGTTGGGTTMGFVCPGSFADTLPFHVFAGETGPFFDVGTGAEGSVWTIGPSGAELIRTGAGTFSLPAIAPTPAPTNTTKSRITVGIDGSPWIAIDTGNIYHLSLQTGQWQAIPGLAKDLAVTSDGTLWAIGTQSTTGGFHIYFWNGSVWTQVSPGSGVYIAGGPNDGGQPWVTNDSNQIYHRSPDGSWFQLSSGLGHDIAVEFENGGVWVLGTNGIIGGGFPIWHLAVSGWESDPNITGAVSIAGYCGGVFFIDGSFTLWQLQTS